MTGTVYHRRVTTCRAEKVTHANLAELAVWVGSGSHTWGAGVTVTVDGYRTSAAVGSWLVKVGPRFEVWTDEAFTRDWVPVVER